MQISLDNGDFDKALMAALRHLTDEEVFIKGNNVEGIVLFRMILRDIIEGKYNIVPAKQEEPKQEEDK